MYLFLPDSTCASQCPLYQVCDEVQGTCAWDLTFQDARFCDHGKLHCFINPLRPDIKIHILFTVLYAFLMELVRRICLNINTSHTGDLFLYSHQLSI